MAVCPGVGDGVFTPYEKMRDSSVFRHNVNLGSIKKWVATEKIHGANFSFTVCEEESTGSVEVKVARRNGLLKHEETFFGINKQPRFVEDECEKAHQLYLQLRKKEDIKGITIYGELFGGYYPHPSVPTSDNVSPVQREVVYCPDLKFMAFDIAKFDNDKGSPNRSYMDYDICMELFKSCGFLYAEPLATGNLQDMIIFPLGFDSTIPPKLGLPPLPTNVAEGIVVKPLKNVQVESKGGMKRVIFKRKVKNFCERKIRREEKKKLSLPDTNSQMEYTSLKYEILALITPQRIVNTISKLGLPNKECTNSSDPSWKDIESGLMADVIAELKLDDDEWEKFNTMPRQLKEALMTELREECKTSVEEYNSGV